MSEVHYIEKFLRIAQASPSHIAVCENEKKYSYGAFLGTVNALASSILEKAANSKILIHLPAGMYAYASMFAAGLAGGYYCPMNIKQPLSKREAILEKFNPDVIISDITSIQEMNFDPKKTLIVEELAGTSTLVNERRNKIAYVIFTSGSTGDPKGVVIGQAALSHYVNWVGEVFNPTFSDRWSQHPNIAFDLSVLDIYGALCHGAALYTMSGELERMVPSRAVHKYGLTIWNSVPSVLDMMIKAGGVNPINWQSLRIATFCGEPLRRRHLDAIFSARPDLSVFNTYGPTEATVSCTLRHITANQVDLVSRDSIALGDVIPGMNLKLMADGVEADEGEIILYGNQLADGYWQDELRTLKSFRAININGVETVAYFTGDWGYREGEELFFKKRIDDQIKIKGFRLELEEINNALYKCGFLTAVTIFSEGNLYSFIQTKESIDISIPDVRRELANWLDPHAIPRYIIKISEFPTNSNDKLDFNKLLFIAKNGLIATNE